MPRGVRSAFRRWWAATGKRRDRAAAVGCVLALVAAAIVVPFADRLTEVVGRWGSNAAVAEVRAELASRLSTLQRGAAAIAAESSVRAVIARNDAFDALASATDEARVHGVSNVILMGSDGAALARTASPARYGDHLSLTSVWGRQVAAGKDVASPELGTVRGSLILLGGAPVRDGDKVMGGAFAWVSPNDAYARAWRDAKLAPGQELAFYGNAQGIAGSSFDEETSVILSSYFSPLSGFVGTSASNWARHVRLNNQYYFIHGIPLVNAEGESLGQLLLFVPTNPVTVASVVAILLACAFLAGVGLSHLRRRRLPARQVDIEAYHLAILGLVVLGGCFALLHMAIGRSALVMQKPPYVLYNSTMHLEPETAVVTREAQLRVAITVVPGGEAINAARAVVRFDPAAVRVTEILTSSSFCDEQYFLERQIDEAAGRVVISCGVFDPGFTGERGTVAELVVQPLRSGPFSLTFEDGTQVLAHDGLGTDVLRVRTNGSYQVPVPGSGDGSDITLFSPTHPNAERWYRDRNIRMAWRPRPGHDYRYALTDDPRTVPTSGAIAVGADVVVAAPSDGTYYFHLIETKGGKQTAVAHYPLRIDSVPPPAPTVRASETNVTAGQVVRFDFENRDLSATRQPGFYIRMGSSVFFPVRPPLHVPFLEPGEYPVDVRVFDAAGNFSDSRLLVNVEKR